MFRKLIAVAVVSVMAAIELSAGGAGTTSAAFLKIVPAARPAAMGGTYAGIGDDVNSIVSNPAGLALISNKEVSVTQISWIESITYQHVAIGLPLSFGVIGIGVNSLSITGMERRIAADDNYIDLFAANDMAMGLSYAKKIGNKMSMGINLKSISSTIDGVSAGAMGIDIGGLYMVNDKMNIGLAVQNLGTKMKFVTEEFPLPQMIKLGLGFKVKDNFVLGLDLNSPNSGKAGASLGGEYVVKFGKTMSLPIRVGYVTGIDLASISYGIGFSMDSFGVDITMAPYGDFGNTMRAGLKFAF